MEHESENTESNVENNSEQNVGKNSAHDAQQNVKQNAEEPPPPNVGSQGAAAGKKYRWDLILAFIVVFLDFAIWGLSISWMPNIFSLEHGATTYGIVQSGYTLIQLMTAPLMGRISDISGRTSVVFVSQSMRGIIMFVVVCVHPYTVTKEGDAVGLFCLLNFLVVISFLRGFNHTFTVVKALVGDISSSENRRSSVSFLYAMVGLGFSAGSGFAMLWKSMEFRMMMTCVLCGVASALSGLSWVVSQMEEKKKEKEKPTSINLFRGLKTVSSDKVILILLAVDVMLSVSYKSFTSVLGSFCLEKLGIEGQAFSRTMGIMGATYTITQATVTPYWSKRMDEIPMVLLATLLLAFARFMMAFVSTELQLQLIYLLVHMGAGASDIVVAALFTRCSAPGTTGFTLGFADSCRGVVGVFIPTAVGIAFDRFGPVIAACVSGFTALGGFTVLWYNSAPIQERLDKSKNDKIKKEE